MGVTIKDVAQAAGVSISTVSKVLNGHYSISEKTADHVRRVMGELNYYPSANAQSFASGASRTVVLLADLSPNMAFQNPHMFEIVAGFEGALRKRGYRLILQGTDETSACGLAEEIISRRSADAIAIHVGVMSHPLSAVLTRLQFPHIVLGMPNFDSQVCWIDNNNTYSGTVAASYLLSQGYRKIAFIGGKYYDLGSAHRLQGVKQGLTNAGMQLDRYGLTMFYEDWIRRPCPMPSSAPITTLLWAAWMPCISGGCASRRTSVSWPLMTTRFLRSLSLS